MAAQPKRKHSTRRKGKRLVTKRTTLGLLVNCKNCNQPKRSHYMCENCGK